MNGRTAFHLSLAGAFTLCLFPFISWWFAMHQPSPDPSGWRRRLMALAVLDTLLMGMMIASSARATKDPELANAGRPKIGVYMDDGANGVVVREVGKDMPAEDAGVLVGDRITNVDDVAVTDRQQLTKIIGETPKGSSRTLRVHRGEEDLSLVVTPAKAKPRTMPLFERLPDRDWSLVETLKGNGGAAALLISMALAAIVSVRKKVGLRPILIAMSAIALHTAVSIGVSLLLFRTVGASLGTSLLAMIAGGLTMLGIALIGMRGLEQPPAPAEPLGTFRAVITGVFYAFAGALRAGIVILFATTFLHAPNHPASDVFGLATSWGPAGIALFVVAAVIVAPIAEESLFRGVLLPWLMKWTSPTTAVFVSAAIFGIGHLFYGVSVLIPFVYGLALGFIRLRTGHLRASMLLHGVLNASASALMLYMSTR